MQSGSLATGGQCGLISAVDLVCWLRNSHAIYSNKQRNMSNNLGPALRIIHEHICSVMRFACVVV